MRKSRGPSIEPWDTPADISGHEEEELETTTLCYLSER